MEKYIPPFTITDTILNLAVNISEKAGMITAYHSFDAKPHLRRNNRIRSIHSSLAIEANSLSLGEVKDVIDGKTVIGLEKEIQEVKNAYAAYNMIGSFDPYSLKDLQKMHGVMTYLILQDSGVFRRHNEGVFDGDRCIFMAPPPEFVPSQMEALFGWLNESRNNVHPLILSNVFHYEFVFIHPFTDGNGRIARLWQTALLEKWKPIFQYLPIESGIYEFQDEYYQSISSSHIAGNSDVFIEFMLRMIDLTLERALQQITDKDAFLSKELQKLLDIMEYDVPYSAVQLMEALKLKSRDSFKKNYLDPALKKELITMSLPDKPTSRNQTYIKK